MPAGAFSQGQAYRRRRLAALGAVALGVAGAIVWAVHQGGHGHSAKPARAPAAHATRTDEGASGEQAERRIRLVQRPLGRLAAPVQDAAAATVGRNVLLLGGLTASDTSRSDVRVVARGRDSAAGNLPSPVHDAAAVPLGGRVYLFGGGTGTAQVDQIVEVNPSTGSTRTVAHLPQPSSDQAAAALDGTAYVVGGYTGTAWLNTVVAWRPGRPARVVAHLPTALRYAAVTTADERIVIAGGSLPSGAASR